MTIRSREGGGVPDSVEKRGKPRSARAISERLAAITVRYDDDGRPFA